MLDPACGSGTFVFHAVRRLAAAGRAAGWTGPRILQACADQVRGLDVHPVAVTLARVTWLLALGDLVRDRPAKLTVPVFLGDAMQWNLRRYVGGADVLVEVPGDQPLHIPAGFAEDQAAFEAGLDALNQGLADEATPEAVGRALRRIEGAAPADADALAGTFARLQRLYRAGRNGIWTFVFRNLARPVWLSRAEQRADVLVGNPPWIVYRHLSPGMKDRLREVFKGKTRAEWCELMEHTDVCFAPVLTMAEAAEHPHNVARQMIVERDGLKQPAPAPRFSRTVPEITRSPQHAGQGTVDALADWGIPKDRIDKLVEDGAVVAS